MDEWAGERLRARAPVEGDRDGYVALFTDPEVERWLRPGPLPRFREEDLVAMLRDDLEHWELHGFGPWALVSPESGEMIGRGGLRWTTVEEVLAVELPWTVHPVHQSQGVASEAARMAIDWARSLQIGEVVTLVLPGNTASRRVAENAGFRIDREVLHSGFPHLLYRRDAGEG